MSLTCLARCPAFQAVRIFVEVFQRHHLGTDVSVAEGILAVTANRMDTLPIVDDADSTHGFAEIAGSVVFAVCDHGFVS